MFQLKLHLKGIMPFDLQVTLYPNTESKYCFALPHTEVQDLCDFNITLHCSQMFSVQKAARFGTIITNFLALPQCM